jgi:hypothetical protein
MNKEVVGSWNVISSFVPEVRKAQQRRMQQENRGKDQGEQVKVPDIEPGVRECWWFSFLLQAEDSIVGFVVSMGQSIEPVSIPVIRPGLTK